LIIGLLIGTLSQATGLASALLMIPSLYYFAALQPLQAIFVALSVVALAALPVSWAYAKRGHYDASFATPALIGGALGGAVGTWALFWLSAQNSVAPLYLFAVVSMFLCAREIARHADAI
jgi:uncharacterized membrane protein YfcA